MKPFIAKAETEINAPIEKVWNALTDPKLVKEWLFGTDMHVSKWEVGGSITYKGEWQGNSYEDKGEILEIIPNHKLVSSYWSSFSGLPDKPENYQKVTYELENKGDQNNHYTGRQQNGRVCQTFRRELEHDS